MPASTGSASVSMSAVSDLTGLDSDTNDTDNAQDDKTVKQKTPVVSLLDQLKSPTAADTSRPRKTKKTNHILVNINVVGSYHPTPKECLPVNALESLKMMSLKMILSRMMIFPRFLLFYYGNKILILLYYFTEASSILEF